MEWFRGGTCAEVIALRLDPGDDVLKSVAALAAEADIRAGAVVSGMGTLKAARLHWVTTTGYPAVEEFRDFACPLEIAGISGIIADHRPHLHTCISDTAQTYAGHLEPGCTVLYLAEIVVVKFGGIALERVPHPEKGTPMLRRMPGPPGDGKP
jgi:hypothetical protein